MDFSAQLESFIQRESLFEKGQKVLLAVSGGLDSVVLAHALHRLGYPFAIAHCNFHLRKEESDGDEKLVEKLAQNWKVDFFRKDFDTVSKSESEGISTQMAARELRYAWFEEIRHANAFHKIVTAHHQNDVLETVLLNLVRGTGIAGFHGIKAKNGHIVRPLLFATREEIENYASQNHIVWREDSSNSSNKYARNLIRNEVIPLLKQLNPSLEQTIKSTTEKILLTESFLENELAKKANTLLNWENTVGKIEINSILSEKDSLFVLYSILKTFDFELDMCKQILDSTSKTSGKVFYSKTYKLIKDRDFWLLNAHETARFDPVCIHPNTTRIDITFEHKISIGLMEGGTEKISSLKKDNALFFDYDKLQFPLLVRKWRDGDVMRPFGMKGKKKVSDIFVDSKLSLVEKQNVFILEMGGEILGILGIRSSNRCMVDSNTKRIWQIKDQASSDSLSDNAIR